ncbi:MAG: hypothetical protein SGPRY_012897, partial [Prymnesium sp.]
VIDYSDLLHLTPSAVASLRRAFVGDRAYGIVGVQGVPSFASARRVAFDTAARLAVEDEEAREQCAAVRQTYPGWNGTPGRETHPLQSCWIHNIKEEVGTKQVDPFYGKNVWPSEQMRRRFTSLNECMYEAALMVLRGCDKFLEQDHGALPPDRLSFEQIGTQGSALAGRWIWYDSSFSRDDDLLETKSTHASLQTEPGGGSFACAGYPDAVAAASEDCTQRTITQSCEETGLSLAKGGGSSDGLASMRTHATAIRSTGAADSISLKGGGSDDGMASMRTHATAIRSTGAADSIPLKGGGSDDGMASMRTHATASRTNGVGAQEIQKENAAGEPDTEMGRYWLPWHIDSQFVTLLTSDDFYSEATGELLHPPQERDKVGLVAMNRLGEVAAIAPQLTPDTMLLQMGGFAQIYSGGVVNACRHAVLRQSAQLGVARATYCNFWYAPWDLMCVPAGGAGDAAVNQGWNALMDNSYVNISMQRSFSHFREFFTSVPVANEPSADPSFALLAEALPLAAPAKACPAAVLIDVATDIRCPFSYIACLRLKAALEHQGATSKVILRFHPVFLDPSISEQGEDLEGYLMREHGVTLAQTLSEDYPLTRAAAEMGVRFHPGRRVVNTTRAFCALAIAAEEGAEEALFDHLSREYFVHGADISSLAVLRTAMRRVGLAAGTLSDEQLDACIASHEAQVHARYRELASTVPEVPCFLMRTAEVGDGLAVWGPKPVGELSSTLQLLLKPKRSAAAGVALLQQPKGIRIAGLDSECFRLTCANPTHPVR